MDKGKCWELFDLNVIVARELQNAVNYVSLKQNIKYLIVGE